MALVIAVEGLPATGKSTFIRLAKEELADNGFRVEVVDTSTTGDAPRLRALAKPYPSNHRLRIVLFWAIHLQQCQLIEEAAKRADVVFVDHLWGTDIAVNLYGKLVPPKVLEWIWQNKPQPQITFLFEAPLEVVRKRRKKISKTLSDPRLGNRIQRGFRKLAELYSWIRVDATRTPEEIKNDCLKIIYEKLIMEDKTSVPG